MTDLGNPRIIREYADESIVVSLVADLNENEGRIAFPTIARRCLAPLARIHLEDDVVERLGRIQ